MRSFLKYFVLTAASLPLILMAQTTPPASAPATAVPTAQTAPAASTSTAKPKAATRHHRKGAKATKSSAVKNPA